MFPWNLLSNQNSQFNDWMKKLNDSGLEQHIDQLLSKFKDNQTFASFNKGENKNNDENISILETFDYVFVIIKLYEKTKREELTVSYSYNQLFITGLMNESETIIYTLPSLVKKSNAEVKWVEDKLEIKLQKFHDNNRIELNVR